MKHTPTPWEFDELEMKIKGTGDIEGRTVIANVSTKMDYSRGHNTQCANAKRIVACVNAMAGIDNPEQWIAMAKTHLAASESQAKQNKRLRDQLDRLGKIALAIANYVRPLEEQVNMKRTINAILGNKAGGSK